MPYWLLRALLLVLPRVPLRVLAGLVWAGGGLVWHTSRRLRETTTDHMRHVLGSGAPRRHIEERARDCVRAAAWYWIDLALIPRLTPEETFARLDYIEGIEALFEAYDEGRGVVLLSAHLGNPEVIATLLPCLGLPSAIFVEPLPNPRVHTLIEERRERAGAQMLAADSAGLRTAIAHVRCGGVLGGLADRDVLGTGKPTVFFDERASMPDGLMEIAVRAEAAVLVGWVTRTAPGRYAASVERLVLPQPSGDRRRDLDAAEAVYMQALERAIARTPGQWFPLAPVWRGLQ
jgi:KDO2-lipid IV(A) lauroyltransferase